MAGEDWPLVPLGELTENFDGRRVPVKEIDRKPGPYPYYGASGIVDHVDGYIFDGEYLLIGEDGENLRTRQTPIAFMATGKFWVNNHAHIVRGNHRADTRFLNYVLSQTDISAYLTGSTMPKLTQGNLNRLPVIAPPLAKQKAIAAVLGALDEKINLNRRMNATLEAMARALFQSWFVDFDPVRAKRDARSPAALDPATAVLFPEHLEDSPLGHIPKGWKAGTVVEGFNLTMGQSPPGDTYNEESNGLPFYQGRTDFGFRFPTPRIYCTAPTRYAKPGDTLVSVRAPVGDINMVNEECCIGRGVAAVRHKSGATSFTYYSMANLYPDFARFEAEGTVFGSINKDSFEKLRFVIPPDEIVAAYERQAGPLDEQIGTLENQSRTLAALRDALLPKLLSGELSISAIGDHIP